MTELSPRRVDWSTALLKHKRTWFALAIGLVVFFAVRVTIHPVNTSDYNVRIRALAQFWSGHSPYKAEAFYELPWTIFVLAPLTNQPLETWLALSIAIFVATALDLGLASNLMQLLHPVFITLIVSSNPEWLYVGPGLWLLYRVPKGWGRGLAWLFLACKPQATAFLLLADGWDAIRDRDWKAFAVSGIVAVITLALFPDFLTQFAERLDVNWSGSVIYHYHLAGAILVTLLIIAIRWRRLRDTKTLGLVLASVWSPYSLQYSYTALLFTLRGAGRLRNFVYLVSGILLAALFWQDYHVNEQLGLLGMVLLAAILAPDYGKLKDKLSFTQRLTTPRDPETASPGQNLKDLLG